MTNLEAIAAEMESWRAAIDELKKDLKTVLEDIHSQKDKIQELRNQVDNELAQVKYVRDDKRLVLSAPEIIIGNVDRQGHLIQGGQIILRGEDICLSGVGKTANVHAHAANIRLVNDDQGPDGNEAFVHDGSKIVALGKAISMKAENYQDIFVSGEDIPTSPGQISFTADNKLELLAQKDRKILEATIKSRTETLGEKIDPTKNKLASIGEEINKIIEEADENSSPAYNIDPGWWHRHFFYEAKEHQKEYKEKIGSLYDKLIEFEKEAATIVEAKRQHEALGKIIIPSSDNFEKADSGCQITINSEKIDIESRDAKDFRTTAASQVNIQSPKINLITGPMEDVITPEGKISMKAQDVDIDTSEPSKKDDQGKQTLTTRGTVKINSREITLQSLNYSIDKDGKATEADTEDPEGKGEFGAEGSHLYVRTNHVNIDTNKVDGTASGSVAVVSKDIDLYGCKTTVSDGKRTVDVNGAKAEKSNVRLMADSIAMGSLSDKLRSSEIQVESDKIDIKTYKTTDISYVGEGEGPKIGLSKEQYLLQRKGNSIKVDTSLTKIDSETQITKDTTIDVKLTVPYIEVHTKDNKGQIQSDYLGCPDISSSDITATGTIKGKTLNATTELIAPNTKKS